MKKVTRENIKLGGKVIDSEGNKGQIIECEDLHNIFVKGKNWTGLYCFVDGCDENSEKDDPLRYIDKKKNP